MLASLERLRASERRFLADASHELRTPVTTLLGNVEYAARHGADAEVLAELRRDAARLARLVDDLLVLERAGAGRARARAAGARCSWSGDVVADCGDDRRRLRLGASQPVRVRGDEDALRRVLRQPDRERARARAPGGTVTVTLGAHRERPRRC